MVIVHGELLVITRWYKQHGVIFRNIPPGVSQDHGMRDPGGSGDGEWLLLATGHSASKWFQFKYVIFSHTCWNIFKKSWKIEF